MARLPVLQANNDFVAACRDFRQFCLRRNLNVDVAHQPRIVRYDVIKISRVLQRSNNRVACALEDADHASLASISIFGASLRDLATDPHDDAITVHCSAGVFRRDKNVRLAGFFRDKETVASLMNRQFSGD